ncbi:MAG: Flp family type IVb pilin, partial [Gemmatimonadota bacterium]
MLTFWNAFWSDESGQDLAEYALLIALIALVVIAAVTLLGQNINTV